VLKFMRHLPKQHRDSLPWRHVAAELDKGADAIDVSIAVRMAPVARRSGISSSALTDACHIAPTIRGALGQPVVISRQAAHDPSGFLVGTFVSKRAHFVGKVPPLLGVALILGRHDT
jgi:hypothetical protein